MDDATYNATMLAAAEAHAARLGVDANEWWTGTLAQINARIKTKAGVNWTAVLKLISDIAAGASIATLIADLVAVFSS